MAPRHGGRLGVWFFLWFLGFLGFPWFWGVWGPRLGMFEMHVNVQVNVRKCLLEKWIITFSRRRLFSIGKNRWKALSVSFPTLFPIEKRRRREKVTIHFPRRHFLTFIYTFTFIYIYTYTFPTGKITPLWKRKKKLPGATPWTLWTL